MEFLDRGDGTRIAFLRTAGNGPTLVFLPGYGSDMTGDKATRLAADASARGLATLRLDYSGHGASGGAFDDGTIGQWRDDVLAVIDAATGGELVLAGSSMGGWIALLAALARPERVTGLLLIAPAPDFTEWGMWEKLDAAARAALARDGRVAIAGHHPTGHVSRRFIDDGRTHALLGGPIGVRCPVRILQGQRDDAVPWRTALRIAELVPHAVVTLITDGDHRLSRPPDLDELCDALGALLRGVGRSPG